MAERMVRPSPAWLIGVDCLSVEVPGWAADWLMRETNFELCRPRGDDDRALAEVLRAIRVAAMRWRALGSDPGTDSGTNRAVEPEPAQRSIRDELSVREAGDLAGVSGRAIRRAITEKRLPADLIGGRYVIRRSDVERYARERRAA